jgi:hypothetical protein
VQSNLDRFRPEHQKWQKINKIQPFLNISQKNLDFSKNSRII